MKLVVLIPAYNEEKTIGKVIEEIPKSFSSIDKIEIIVIDDGSTDKTVDVAKKMGAMVFSFSQNQGLAKAISYGFAKGIERNADILIILDADSQYDSKQIPIILKPIFDNQADIVLGDRQVKKLGHMSSQKKFGNRMVSSVVSGLIGQKINDAQTGFRAFNRTALSKVHIFSGYTYTQETLLQAKFKGLKIVEVPVSFRERKDESRLISNIFIYAIRTVSLILSTIIFYKSTKFFGILTVTLFIVGIGLSAFLLNHLSATGNIRPYYPSTILTALFLITAMISALMTILSSILRRHSILQEEILQKLKDKSKEQES